MIDPPFSIFIILLIFAIAALSFGAGDRASQKGYKRGFAITITVLLSITTICILGLAALLVYELIPARTIICRDCGHRNHWTKSQCFNCQATLME